MKRKLQRGIVFLKKYIRSCDKKRKPRFIKLRGALLVFLVVLFIEFLFLANFFGRISFDHFLASIFPDTIVELTNIRRGDAEINILAINSILNKAAQAKAEDMAEKGYFAHTCPNGVTPWYWFDLFDYNYRYAGENLAVNFKEAEKIDEAWMNSPTHRDNIINENFEEIGVGVANGEYKGKEATFVVQLFGTKMDRVIDSPIITELKEDVVVASLEEKTILGEDIEKEDTVDPELEEELGVFEIVDICEDEEKESFAFIGRGKDNPFYVIGAPDRVVNIPEEEKEYPSFWANITSSPKRSFTLFALIMGTTLLFTILGKFLLIRRINLTYSIVNQVMVFLIVISALATSHYVLQFTTFWW